MTVLRLTSRALLGRTSLSKIWLFAGTPEHPQVLVCQVLNDLASSDNPRGAGNQQETNAIVPRETERRLVGSSETTRQTRRLVSARDDIVRAAWRHAEVGRNAQPSPQSVLADSRKLTADSLVRSNKSERSSLSGKFRRA
jgi:hypothetical protein